MAHAKNHDYHVLPPSIWPFLGGLSAFIMLFGAVIWMHGMGPWMFLIGFVGVLYVMFAWWSEVIQESQQGDHTPVVRIGLRYGFILFIMSEVMFFAAWFWSFFKHALYPMNEYVGSTYVPPEFYQVDPFHLPLINTLVLLLSGCAVTWAHHVLVHDGNRKEIEWGLLIAVDPRHRLHLPPGLRIPLPARGTGLGLRPGQVLLELLHGDGLPRLPRHHRDDLPLRLLPPRPRRPLHRREARGLRGGRLVLALRRRGVAVPLLRGLHLGHRLITQPSRTA
jgi:hypothetical protein